MVGRILMFMWSFMALHMGGCQNYGPFLGPQYSTAPKILGHPKGDHNFDSQPYGSPSGALATTPWTPLKLPVVQPRLPLSTCMIDFSACVSAIFGRVSGGKS